MVMKIIPCTMNKNDFIKFIEEQLKEFIQHVYRGATGLSAVCDCGIS